MVSNDTQKIELYRMYAARERKHATCINLRVENNSPCSISTQNVKLPKRKRV